MDVVKVEGVDHLGIIAGVIQDIGIIEMIDSRITPDKREEISTLTQHIKYARRGKPTVANPQRIHPSRLYHQGYTVADRRDSSAR